MRLPSQWRSLLRSALFVFVLLGPVTPEIGKADNSVATDQESIDSAVREGIRLERAQRWPAAIEHYEAATKSWPEEARLELGLRRSRIHEDIDRRYADQSYSRELLALKQPNAMLLLSEVMNNVHSNYVDPVTPTSFVAHGTESLYLALANPRFLDRNLPGVSPEAVRRFRDVLRTNYWNRRLRSQQDAVQTVLAICSAGRELTGLSSAAIVLEYVCGGCNALDDYSRFLTPDIHKDHNNRIEGEFVGLGIEIKAVEDDGILLANVLVDSPAERGGLIAGEFIVEIDGVDSHNMSVKDAARMLRGLPGSTVNLEVYSPDNDRTRRGQFTRRAVHVRSIPIVRLLDRESGIGYIQMSGFQRSTGRELDDAIQSLMQQGMRKLVWDLRGNPGGLLTAAVDSLDRFIDNGVLVSTRGRTRGQNSVYRASGFNTYHFPLVLLVDGNSASASEIVAGAIRDHSRGTIIGSQTYGKWEVQTILPLDDSSGLKLTTAKFYSPNGKNHSKVGVEPTITIPESEELSTYFRGPTRFNPSEDVVLQKGIEVLRQNLVQR